MKTVYGRFSNSPSVYLPEVKQKMKTAPVFSQDRLEKLKRENENIELLGERFGRVIRAYRRRAGIRQADLAELAGVSCVAVSHWENGTARPDADTINRLCRLLKMPAGELFGLDEWEHEDESELLFCYRALSEYGRLMALASINGMAESEERMRKSMEETVYTSAEKAEEVYEEAESREEDEKLAREKDLQENFRFLEVLSTPAAAGAGCVFGDCYPDYTFARINARNYNSDAIVRVSGHSMEPAYYNGELVYLKYNTRYAQGDDVVCSTADGAVIKRVGKEGLYSVNPDYPFGIRYDDDRVRVVGKVMGKVQPDDLAPDCDKPVLSEIHVREVRQFIKKVRPGS